ncbi:5834_t:CDS:1, partial [Dentiscutata heterogama]
MDALIPNKFVHNTNDENLDITTGIPYKIINDGHYLDNGGGDYGSYVILSGYSYDRNDSNYSRQIWFLEESSNFGEYRISSNGKFLDTFGGENGSEVRISYKNHFDSPYYSRQLLSFLNQNDSKSKKVQIQNLLNKCYLDNWGAYSTVHFSSNIYSPRNPLYSRQLWKFETSDYKLNAVIENFKYDKKINDLDSYTTKVSSVIFTSRNLSCCSNSWKAEITPSENTPNITSWSFNKTKEITFLDQLDVDVKAEYAGVKGTFHEIIKWKNKSTSLNTTKKLKLDETNISGNYLIEIQNKEEVE